MTRYYTGRKKNDKKAFSEKIELEYYPFSDKTVLRMVSAIISKGILHINI